ncbi:hypothetical protein C5S35_08680 [Candidatus Methanophagaceae archaeon]|nr:hypothetical protein C5S35_08680 [Methanophagales archaeon]
MEEGMINMLCLKVLIISIALAIVALSIAYCQIEGNKLPQGSTEGNTISLIPPPFMKTSQNRDKI